MAKFNSKIWHTKAKKETDIHIFGAITIKLLKKTMEKKKVDEYLENKTI